MDCKYLLTRDFQWKNFTIYLHNGKFVVEMRDGRVEIDRNNGNKVYIFHFLNIRMSFIQGELAEFLERTEQNDSRLKFLLLLSVDNGIYRDIFKVFNIQKSLQLTDALLAAKIFLSQTGCFLVSSYKKASKGDTDPFPNGVR